MSGKLIPLPIWLTDLFANGQKYDNEKIVWFAYDPNEGKMPEQTILVECKAHVARNLTSQSPIPYVLTVSVKDFGTTVTIEYLANGTSALDMVKARYGLLTVGTESKEWQLGKAPALVWGGIVKGKSRLTCYEPSSSSSELNGVIPDLNKMGSAVLEITGEPITLNDGDIGQAQLLKLLSHIHKNSDGVNLYDALLDTEILGAEITVAQASQVTNMKRAAIRSLQNNSGVDKGYQKALELVQSGYLNKE